MLARAFLAVLVCGALLHAPAALAAEPPVFGAPLTVAQNGADPSVAVGPGGDAVLAWSGLDGGVFVARRGGESNSLLRPAGGTFGQLRTVRLPPGAIAPGNNGATSSIGIDALGDSVHVSLVGGIGTDPAARIVATVHTAGMPSVVAVSDPAETETVPVVGFDGFGNGVVAWSSPGSGGGAIRAAAYSAAAPVVSALRVGKRELRLRVSEPALVGVAVRGPHRTRGEQLFLARAGFNRVAFTRKLSKALRRRGRYTVIVRTADAGPRRGLLKIRIRRR